MTVKIDQPIVGIEVVTEKKSEAVIAVKPYDRPAKLFGTTYKIRPGSSEAALYITINDIELPDGNKRPFEIFINSKEKTHDQFITAMTRLISAVFRMPLPFEFVIEELKEVAATDGSYFIGKNDAAGKGRVKGIVDHIGRVLEAHCKAAGMIKREEVSPVIEEKAAVAKAAGLKAQQCPKCGEHAMYRAEGCSTCVACSFSKCD